MLLYLSSYFHSLNLATLIVAAGDGESSGLVCVLPYDESPSEDTVLHVGYAHYNTVQHSASGQEFMYLKQFTYVRTLDEIEEYASQFE